MIYTDVNFLAVLVAAIVSMGIGMLWYGQLFGKEWALLMGFDTSDPKVKDQMQQGMKSAMVGTFISFLIMGSMLSYYINVTGADSVSKGLNAGFVAWLGFVLTTIVINGLWASNKPKLIAINAGHLLAVMLVTGAILAVWK